MAMFKWYFDFYLLVYSVPISTNVEFDFYSYQSVLDLMLSDKVCQQLTTGLLFARDTPVSTTNNTLLPRFN